MQAAVDFNGSKINNGTSITTTLTTEIGSTNQTPSANKQHSTKTTKATVLINEPPNVLRQRVQSHDTYASVTLTTIKAIALTPTTTTKNFACKNNEDEIQRLQPFESSAEYMGSNVQQMAVTPTSSPRASPTNTSEKDIESTLDVIVTDIGSDSNASSLTNSSNSSVLATPILMRGHEKTKVLTSSCCMRNSTGSNRKISELSNNVCSGCDHNEISRRQQPPKTLPLPLTTGSCVFRDFELTTPYTSSSASSTSTSKSLQSVTSSSASKATAPIEAQLLQWKDMPQYLQFNPYVLNGYRPLQTFRGCLLSLFCWHNETVNILTHAIPIIYILIIVPGLMPWDKGYGFLSFCHLFGSVAPWCGSFVYHLFMNIEKGENVYYRLLKLDMVGIWVSQSFGALPHVTATTLCFSYTWKWLIIISYCLLSLWGLYKALTASSPWQRRLCFALPFTMRSILTFFRTFGLVGGNRVTLSHVYLQDGVSILGGAIGAMRIPEKWFPGLVDFYFNSHNIMHVLVVVAVYSMHKATMKDFEWMSETTCEAFNNATNETISQTFGTNTEL